MRNDLVEPGRRQVERVHPTAEEVADDARLPGPADPERLAHEAARTVTADEIPGSDLPPAPAVDADDLGGDAVVVVGEADQPPAVVDRDSRQCFGVAAQDLLDVLLRHAMR
jgi:hypothetical protein